MDGADLVVRLAASADVRFGLQHPTQDLEQNTIATSNVLEAMRVIGVKRIAFASTDSVYGEASVIPTPEDAALSRPDFAYAASKLAAEALIEAYLPKDLASRGVFFASFPFWASVTRTDTSSTFTARKL